uniref:Proteasome assembly chaperone 2 n=1 Tax=Eptatretus burgeri TaxID=7764 RepID=A0A8C4X1T3_EPTBU
MPLEFVASGRDGGSGFRGSTLILPAVSVGNAGQLAVDLVICALSMRHVGALRAHCFAPVVGSQAHVEPGRQPGAQSSGHLCLSTEVYACRDKHLVVLQVRSPIMKGQRRQTCRDLLAWVKETGFQQVVLLSSTQAQMRLDQELSGPQERHLISEALLEKLGSWPKTAGCIALKERPAYPGLEDGGEVCLRIPGGGITRTLHKDLCAAGLPLLVLLTFCSDGDNIPDALRLASHLALWLPALGHQDIKLPESKEQWKFPSSWQLLYGSGIPDSLF